MPAMKSMKIAKCMRTSSLSSNSKASKSAGIAKASTKARVSMKTRVISQRWNKQFKLAVMKYMKDTEEYQLVRRHLCFHRKLKARIVEVFQEHHPEQWVGVMLALQQWCPMRTFFNTVISKIRMILPDNMCTHVLAWHGVCQTRSVPELPQIRTYVVIHEASLAQKKVVLSPKIY